MSVKIITGYGGQKVVRFVTEAGLYDCVVTTEQVEHYTAYCLNDEQTAELLNFLQEGSNG